jgi:hypothetical protein
MASGSINYDVLKTNYKNIENEINKIEAGNKKFKSHANSMGNDGLYGGDDAKKLYEDMNTRYNNNQKLTKELKELQKIMKTYMDKLISAGIQSK